MPPSMQRGSLTGCSLRSHTHERADGPQPTRPQVYHYLSSCFTTPLYLLFPSPSLAEKPYTHVQRDIHKTQSGKTRSPFVWANSAFRSPGCCPVSTSLL